jgi:outer membrane immunogenic protein
MKKLFLGSVALVAMLGGPAAFAADMPLRAPAPVIVANWTGCYVGLSIGTNSGKAKNEYGANVLGIAPGTAATDDINLSGMLGGGGIGCNYQVGAWVFGIEGDWSVTNKDGQAFETAFPGFRLQVTESWLATARGRIGYTVTDKWLWYVTGGGAWARVRENNFSCALAGPPVAFTGQCLSAANTLTAQQTNILSGWTVGLGTEYMLGYGWSIKSEFLYVQFSRDTFFTATTPVALSAFDTKVQDYIFRFGMNYRFGWVGGKGKGVAPVASISK